MKFEIIIYKIWLKNQAFDGKLIYNEKFIEFQAETFDLVHLSAQTLFLKATKTS